MQGCVLCAAGAHADADDLSTPAVGSKKAGAARKQALAMRKIEIPKNEGANAAAAKQN